VRHLARWLAAVALPHAAGDPEIAAACADLLAALDAECARRADPLAPTDLADLDRLLAGVTLPAPVPRPFAESLERALDLPSRLPETAPPRPEACLVITPVG
jgi:hypothetical protein